MRLAVGLTVGALQRVVRSLGRVVERATMLAEHKTRAGDDLAVDGVSACPHRAEVEEKRPKVGQMPDAEGFADALDIGAAI